MHTPILLIVLLCTLLAWSREQVTIAVVDLGGAGVPETHLEILSDRLRAALFETNRFRVIERERMNDVLREQDLQLSECITPVCAVKAGQLIGADKIVVGTVNKVGTLYTVHVRIVDVKTGEVMKTSLTDCDACTIEQIVTTIIPAAAQKLAAPRDSVVITVIDESLEHIPVNTGNPVRVELDTVQRYTRKEYRHKKRQQRVFKVASIPLLVFGYIYLGAGFLTSLTGYAMYDDPDGLRTISITAVSCMGGGLVLIIPGHIFSSKSKKIGRELKKRRPVGMRASRDDR